MHARTKTVRVGAIYGAKKVERYNSDSKHYPHGFRYLYRVLGYDRTAKRGNLVELDPKTLEEMPQNECRDAPWITQHNGGTPVWIISYSVMGGMRHERKDRAQMWEPTWPFREGEPWAYGKGQPPTREQAQLELAAWTERVNRFFDEMERGSP